jgi:hypothetical protein
MALSYGEEKQVRRIVLVSHEAEPDEFLVIAHHCDVD